jgi:hypothetical protein
VDKITIRQILFAGAAVFGLASAGFVGTILYAMRQGYEGAAVYAMIGLAVLITAGLSAAVFSVAKKTHR